MALNSTPATVASLQVSAENLTPLLPYESSLVSATPSATTLSNEQNPCFVVASAGGSTNPEYQSINTVAPAALSKSSSLMNVNFPLPANLGSNGDSISYEGSLVSATPSATTLSDVVSSAGSSTNPDQSVNTVAPIALSKSSLPMNVNRSLPANLGSAGGSDRSDGAPVASRKGTIMRPNAQSTTAR
jgi:hypothetical protein